MTGNTFDLISGGLETSIDENSIVNFNQRVNNSFLQMMKKVFLNNLNVSYSFHISKVKIIFIA